MKIRLNVLIAAVTMSGMPQNYVEVTVSTTVDSGELLARLQEANALGAWEDNGILHLYWPEERWIPGVVDELKEALLRLGDSDAPSSINVHAVPDRDWTALWSMSLVPIRIGRHFRIRQTWNSPDPSFDGIELVIDPKRAFGTGYHATTQLIIEWLESHVCGGERVLDIGTGTGILAMAALRLGATSALGIDSDPVAVKCATENAVINAFGPELDFRTGSVETLEAGTFDIIVANLDHNTILHLNHELGIRLRRGGKVCLSGLQIEGLQEIMDTLAGAGGRIVGKMERDEWMALEVRF